MRLGEWVAGHGVDSPEVAHRAARDLLLNAAPRLLPGESWDANAGETLEGRARRLARALDRGVLPVQGPPGSGKTYLGARMICELVAAGRKVAVTGPSHKVIRNLLDAVLAAAAERKQTVRVVQKVREDDVGFRCAVPAGDRERSRPRCTAGRGSGRPRRHGVALGPRRCRRHRGRAVRGRSGADVVGQHPCGGAGGEEPGPARRPAAARTGDAGLPSGGHRRLRAASRARGRADAARRSRVVPAGDVAHASADLRVHLGGLLRRPA